MRRRVHFGCIIKQRNEPEQRVRYEYTSGRRFKFLHEAYNEGSKSGLSEPRRWSAT